MVLANDPATDMDCRWVRDNLSILLAALPEVAQWLRATTRALDLLPQRFFAKAPEGALVSCSSPEVPGFIRITRCREPLKLLEMVVHETAHLYLFRAEAAGPLIDETSQLSFSSPLRHEPRPLRGILLALHACAYIAAAYAVARHSSIEAATAAEAERLRVLALFEESRTIVASALPCLTEAGLEFVRRTQAVARFADSN
jgi:HEXXH motif-containing protein